MEGRVTDEAVFAGYEPDGFFDEAFAAPGEPRDHYRRLVRDIELLGHDELARRARLRDASFRTKGITFTLSGDEDGLERTFPMDLLPRIIPAERVGGGRGRARAAGAHAQQVPRRPVRRRAGRDPRRRDPA